MQADLPPTTVSARLPEPALGVVGHEPGVEPKVAQSAKMSPPAKATVGAPNGAVEESVKDHLSSSNWRKARIWRDHKSRPIRLLIFSWNVGNTVPKKEELEEWLPEEGVQIK